MHYFCAQRFCVEEMSSSSSMYECLKRNKDLENFDSDCLKIIVRREQQHAKGSHFTIVDFVLYLAWLSHFFLLN